MSIDEMYFKDNQILLIYHNLRILKSRTNFVLIALLLIQLLNRCKTVVKELKFHF